MITNDPYRMKGHVIRPGRLEDTPMQECGTMQNDPPEFVAACLSCPLGKCMNDSVMCPLNGITRNRLTKSGKPDKRMAKRQAYMESLDKMCRMIRNGGTPNWICRELGITRETFYRRRAELVRMGRLA